MPAASTNEPSPVSATPSGNYLALLTSSPPLANTSAQLRPERFLDPCEIHPVDTA
jgi:hypothetical protein